MRRLAAPLTLLALGLGSPAAPAATPTALPTISRTLTAPAAVERTCSHTADAPARGVVVSRYTTPMSGFVTARLSGPATSDWDLIAVDHASGRHLATSEAFGSNEVVQSWAGAAQRIDFVACRRSGSARSVRLSIELVDVKPPTGGGTVSVVRVHGAPGQFTALENLGLDVTESRGADFADVLVSSPAQLALIKRTGLPYTTRISDLAAYDARSREADARYTARMGAPGSALPSGRTTYRTYADVQDDLKRMADKYPTLVHPVTLGKTYQGRDITGLEIASDVAHPNGRPDFMLMGEHHAREWPSAEIPLEYALNLLENQSDPRIANLLAHEITTIVPVVNVDGYVTTQQDEQVDPSDHTGQNPTVEEGEDIVPPGGVLAFRRKNCDGEIPSGSFPCELEYGVDNNRNYGNLWGGPGASPDPTSQAYHGPGPRSEPETQAVWNYSRTHQVTALISLHTIAALVLRPPGEHTAGLAPDEARLKQLGDEMAKATGYTSEYGWQLYDTAGTTEDDTYAAEGGYGYTIEMGPAGGVFHGPYQQAVVDQWTKGDVKGNGGLRQALLTIAEAAANRGDHGVIAGSAPAGAVLHLHKDFDTKTSPWCDDGIDPAVNPGLPGQIGCPQGVQAAKTLKDNIDTTLTVPASGQFQWDVNPSTRPFVGGGAAIIKLHDKPDREVSGQGGGPGKDTPQSPAGTYDFTIEPSDAGKLVKIDVSWGTPEDFDIVVYRIEPDGSKTQVGSSGNSPGTPEEVLLTDDKAAPGKYEVEVDDFAAVAGTWTAKVGFYGYDTTYTTGHTEAYTLTCEIGGKAVHSSQVTVGRGQTASVDPCSDAAPAAVSGSSRPAGAAKAPAANKTHKKLRKHKGAMHRRQHAAKHHRKHKTKKHG